MGRHDNEVRVQLSVLDRLIDYEPEMSREAAASRSKNLRILKQAVRRDLEWLLNTRQNPELSAELKEVQSSVAAYGLPDFTNLAARNPSDQQRLRRAIEKAVEDFEPRLEGVVVVFDAADSGSERAVRFRIDGRLKVDPAPEPVVFDTLLEVGSGEFEVKGE